MLTNVIEQPRTCASPGTAATTKDGAKKGGADACGEDSTACYDHTENIGIGLVKVCFQPPGNLT